MNPSLTVVFHHFNGPPAYLIIMTNTLPSINLFNMLADRWVKVHSNMHGF